MQEGPLIIMIMATMVEAKPFVLGMGLEEIEDKPFRLFKKERILLVISGIGKANAAMATAYCCQRFKPACVCNLGAAGAAGFSLGLGKAYQVEKIIEFDRPELTTGNPCIHKPQVLDGFLTVRLSTSDKAILDPEEREEISKKADLMDMEGASVVQACRKFMTPCFVFKFVSDTPDHLKSDDIRGNIKTYRSGFYDFFLNSVLPVLFTNDPNVA